MAPEKYKSKDKLPEKRKEDGRPLNKMADKEAKDLTEDLVVQDSFDFKSLDDFTKVEEIFKNADRYALDSYGEKLIRRAAEFNPLLALKYADKPWAEAVLTMAVEREPKMSLAFLLNKELLYAEEILLKVAEKNPEGSLRHFNEYKDRSYAVEVLQKIAEKYPDLIIKCAYCLRDVTNFKEMLSEAARAEPEAVFMYLDDLIFFDNISTIFQDALKAYPLGLIFVSPKILNRFLAKLDPRIAHEIAFSMTMSQYKYLNILDSAEAESVLIGISKKYPQQVLEAFDRYKNKPYAEAVVRGIAENFPNIVLSGITRYYTTDFGKNIVREIAKKYPELALILLRPYSDPFINGLLDSAVQSDLQIALGQFDSIRDAVLAERLLTEAVQFYPREVLDNAHKFKDKPYAVKIFKTAALLFPWYFQDLNVIESENSSGFDKVFGEKGISKLALVKIFGSWLDASQFLQEMKCKCQFMKSFVNLPDEPVTKEKVNLLSADQIIGALKDYPISIPYNDFISIILSFSFREFLIDTVGTMSFANAFSIVNAVYRSLKADRREIDEESIRQVVADVWDEWQRVKDREIFGPNTKLILFTHEEARFDNEKIVNFYKESLGNEENVIYNGKGVQSGLSRENIVKIKTLEAIRNSKGATTLLFNGHGSGENWAFSENQSDNLNHELAGVPGTINYKELGDALIASNNIENINILALTCMAYDYVDNLYAYLESKGVAKRPSIVITEANRKSFGYGCGNMVDCQLLNAVFKGTKVDKSVTVEDFFNAEKDVWRFEDPSFRSGGKKLWMGKTWPDLEVGHVESAQSDRRRAA